MVFQRQRRQHLLVIAVVLAATQITAFQPAGASFGRTTSNNQQERITSTKSGISLRLGKDASDWKVQGTIAKTNVNESSFMSTVCRYSAICFTAASLMLAPIQGTDHQTALAAPATLKEQVRILETPQPQQQGSPVLEETWTLINKYYVDRSFNGQDWDAVHTKYQQATGGAENDKVMQSITEMVKSLGDRYTRVLSIDQYSAIQKYDLIGVGVTLMPDNQKQIIVGAPPIPGSPSAKAGLKPGDSITSVNGIPTKGRTAFDIIDQISENPAAKTITFGVIKQDVDDGDNAPFDLVLERQNYMQVKDPIQYKMTERRKDGTNVGYIRMAEFNSLAKAKLEDAIADLKKQGANAYVLDLRMNTGGAFQSAVEISSLFVNDRVATYVVDGNNVELPFRTASGRMLIEPDIPIAIWIDGSSASASEVLAGSLRDNCRAVTMGDKSFGKGLIQAVYGLKNGSGLVMTVARYVTPGGFEIQGVGITPDIAGKVGAPPLVPGLSTDTSRVDFQAISKRLDSSMCTIPQEHANPKSDSVLASSD